MRLNIFSREHMLFQMTVLSSEKALSKWPYFGHTQIKRRTHLSPFFSSSPIKWKWQFLTIWLTGLNEIHDWKSESAIKQWGTIILIMGSSVCSCFNLIQLAAVEGLQTECSKFSKEVTHTQWLLRQKEKYTASGWKCWERFITEVMYKLSLLNQYKQKFTHSLINSFHIC